MAEQQSAISRVIVIYYEIFEMLAVVILLTLSIVTVSELASREALSASLQSRIDKLNTDIANYSIASKVVAQNGPMKPFEGSSIDLVKISDAVGELTKLQGQVESLINVGVDSDKHILKSLAAQFQAVGDSASEIATDSRVAYSWIYGLQQLEVLAVLYRLRSDHLLAVALIVCSALGALIVGLRSGHRSNVRTITGGLATGFVVYVALKGGQHVFLMAGPENRIPSNPYSYAFVGLLAGLFSDKAYGVLSTVVDDFASRVSSKPTTDGGGKPVEDGKEGQRD